MNRKPAAFLLLLIVPFVFAQPEHGEEHSGHGSDFLGMLVNFIVLFGGLTLVLYKPVKKFLAQRTKDVSVALKEAEKLKAEMEAKIKESGERLARLNEDIDRIKKQAIEEGEQEKERIIKLAEKEAGRIRRIAEQEVEMILKSGEKELREYAAELAVEAAREKVKKKITKDLHTVLIDRSINMLDNRHEKSKTG
ncbi:MAG: ATP synthase F0 subunit B [Candidatus Aminicenantes bacterium]|nr:ATP synthase F0 subunit B [Candidatus Aminicenantes bacterium]